MADGRIEELRKRLEREPGSRLFAQLAEELRKTGDLAGAIQVARDGLKGHATYHSARMTLARALLESRDLKAARPEFEAVLRAAPDNILASRLLAECLEGLGDLPAAAARFEATLAMAPGDRQVQAHIDALRARSSGPVPVSGEALAQTPPEPATVAAAGADDDPPPIPVVAADEAFELEAAYEAPATRITDAPLAASGGGGGSASLWPAEIPSPQEPEQEFVDFEADTPSAAGRAVEIASRVPLTDEEPSGARGEAPGEIVSPTLAELYFSQGHTDKAIEVYRRILDRDRADVRAAARLAELEALAGAASPGTPPTPGGRREAIERTIAKLEVLRAMTRRAQ